MADNLVWPSDCIEKAKLIRAQAQGMAGDIEAVSLSFITGKYYNLVFKMLFHIMKFACVMVGYFGASLFINIF